MSHDNKLDEQSVQAPGAKWNGAIGIFAAVGLAGAFTVDRLGAVAMVVTLSID